MKLKRWADFRRTAAMIKIHNGTPRHGEASLCRSCQKAMVVKGETLKEEIVRCGEMPQERAIIQFKVTECSSYARRGQPSLWDMEKVAWSVCSDKRTKQIGFYSPQERQRGVDEGRLKEVTEPGPLKDPFTGDW